MNTPTLKFVYRNYKGNYSEREVIPKSLKYIKSIYHQELGESWFMVATDIEKGEERCFAVVDIVKWL
jgi:predicted DNA-binding transcriptional regulator YafY